MLTKIGMAVVVAFALSSAAVAGPKQVVKVAEKASVCVTDEGGGRKLPCDAGNGGGDGGGGGAGGM